MELHRRTLPQDEPEYGENVYKTGEYGIYDMGDYDSYNYRIPAMVTTSKGTLIAQPIKEIQLVRLGKY